jgi:hypothetical protein
MLKVKSQWEILSISCRTQHETEIFSFDVPPPHALKNIYINVNRVVVNTFLFTLLYKSIHNGLAFLIAERSITDFLQSILPINKKILKVFFSQND